MATNATIYGLIDPRTNALRYIGQSLSPHLRLRHHVKPTSLRESSHRARWLSQLREAGLRPEQIVIETVAYAERDEAEIFWIAYFRAIGAQLTNGNRGGGAGGRVKGWHHTPETRAKIAAARAKQPNPRLGTKHSPETLKKLSAWQKGRRLTPEHRAKIGAALLGRKRGPYAKRAQ